MKTSIAQRMHRDILVTFAVIAALFVGLGSLMQLRWKNDNIQTVCRLLDTLVSREQDQIANELFERRVTALQMRMVEISMVEDVSRVDLFDAAGRPVTGAFGGAVSVPAGHLDPPRDEAWDGEAGFAFDHDFEALRFTRPIIAAGETLGLIRIHHDLSLLRKQMLSFFAFFFLLLLIALVCMQVLLRRRLRKSVVAPLEDLGQAMSRMDARTLAFSKPAQGSDLEIANLGTAFEELLARLDSSYRALDEVNEALARSERRLSRAISASTDAIWQWSYETGANYYSPRWYEMLGYEDQELPMNYETWRNLCHPDDYLAASSNIEEAVESKGARSYKAEFRMRAKSGEWKWILGRGDVIERDTNGNPVLLSGTHTDITERKLAEERLRQSEEKFSRLFHLSPDSIVLVGMDDGRLIDVNDTFVLLSGFSREETLGRTLQELGIYRDPSVRDEIYALLGRDGQVRNFEFDACDKAGGIVVCALSCQVVEFEGGQHLLAVIRDVTQMKRMQEMMIQSEKMRSVGGMAAGIAHEINNPLGIILQSAHNLVQRTDPAFPRNREAAQSIGLDMDLLARYMRARKLDVFIADIQAAGVRAAGIIRRMLDFSRTSESGRSECDLRAFIEQSVSLAGSDYDLTKSYDFKKIDVRIDIAEGLPAVSCTETEMEQVFLNLLRNAAQAMAGASPPVAEPRIDIRVSAVEGGVRIEVEDNGPGMDPEVSRRVFEPFYTTKAPGQGTGLGLSVSYFIVTKGHGGSMRVESEPGRGTRFIIELPAEKEK
jgi:PAS domain S-box-containing protein